MAQQPVVGQGLHAMITLRHTTLSWTPLDEWSARRRDLYLTTHDNHKTALFKDPGRNAL